MRVLIIGSSSFVAKDITDVLSAVGHDVITFKRGKLGSAEGVVSGRLEQLADCIEFTGSVDAVINYSILKDGSIEDNVAAIDGILGFCKRANVERLIHLSSISVYSPQAELADEEANMPDDPLSKGAYASLKVATDQRLLAQQIAPSLKIALVRPGFVLGAGLLNPFPGMGFRLPFNRILVFGGGTANVPLVNREHLHCVVERILELEDLGVTEVFHAFDPSAPTRHEFLECCNKELGLSNGIWHFPAWMWLCAGFCFDVLLRTIGKSPLFIRSLKNASSKQQFSCEKTEVRLGLKERIDIYEVIRRSFSRQEAKYHLPKVPTLEGTNIPSNGLSVIGAGRIVETGHLEAFSRLNWNLSKVGFYDLNSREASFGQIKRLQGTSFSGSGFWTIATPAIVHIDAADLLKSCDGHCLIEKPLALNRDEFERWKQLSHQDLSVGVCHNYRFKENVRKMRHFIDGHAGGELLGVSLLFQSPPVRGDSSPWIRDERCSQSLLMDYSIHFLDLACMFQAGDWKIDALDWLLDQNGDTEVIRGRCSNDVYPLNFHLQQGFCTRTCKIEYVFRNYTVVLNFFPDSFHIRMSPEGAGTATIAAFAAWRGTLSKISEKLSKQKADGSHAYCYVDLLANGNEAEIGLSSLRSYYELLFEISDRVYGK